MRIAVWYEGPSLGRNDGNPLYVTSFLKRIQFFHDRFEKRVLNHRLLNHFPYGVEKDTTTEAIARHFYDKFGYIEVEHIRPYGENNHIFGRFDLHIWVDWGEDALTELLGYKPIYPPGRPLAYWASDTHLGYDYRLSCAKQADFVFAAQEDAVEKFKLEGIDAVWLPHAFEPQAYPVFDLASKRYDVCFVGHVNSENRIDALDKLFREFPNFFYGQRRFEQASRKYAESKVVFNIAMKDDLNMRVFETLGSKSFLLTDRVQSIEKLFVDGKHLVLYNNLDEMVDKARYFLAHDDLRDSIAKSGYKEVLKNHTFANRVEKILETCFSEKCNKKEFVCQ